MTAILLVLRTGCQWAALDATGICTKSSVHRRFMEWTKAGVFAEFWRQGLLAYDALKGTDWTWVAMDGAMMKAPLGGKKPTPTQLIGPSAGAHSSPWRRSKGRAPRSSRGR